MTCSGNTSIQGVIEHYQRSIERCQDDEGRLLHCINKLYKLPVKVEHLQETGIGKTVNSLRKFNGEIGVAAKALVTKWKAMVAAEEEPLEVANCQTNEDELNGNRRKDGSSDEDQPDLNRNNSSGKKDCSNAHQEQKQRSSSTSKEKDTKHKQQGEGGSSSSRQHHNLEKSSHHEHSTSELKVGTSHSNSEKKDHERHHKSHKRAEKSVERKEPERKREKESRSSNGEKLKQNGREKSSSSHHKRSKESNSSSSKRKPEHGSEERQRHTSKSLERAVERESEKEIKNREGSGKHSSKDIEKHASSSNKKSSAEKHEKSSSKAKEHRDKHKSTSSHTSSTSAKPSTSAAAAATAAADRKRRHHSDNNTAGEQPAAKPKHAKSQKRSADAEPNADDGGNDVDDDGIDSSMGANFADVLGMLNMPTKKSKKSLTNAPNSVANNPSCSRSGAGGSGSSSKSSSKSNGLDNTASTSSSSSKFSPDVKPDLLSSSAKLEPLDPSIALELPTISTNYKPMPLNQTVMDCVFNTSNSSASRAPQRTLTDAEAISHGISSKTMRTKIYSGVKTGQILQVPSLFDLCIRVLQKNIDALEYTGGVPFEVLRPVIERASPQQLLIFEEYNPYLMEDCDVLWKQHVQRNYRTQKRQEMESWREMFLRCQEDQERKLNILAESIKQSQKIISAPVRKTQLAFVDSMVKPPRNVLRKQEQYGTKSKLVATPASRVATLSSVTPNAAKTGDARLRVAPQVRDHAQVSSNAVRSKKAPLMAKTLQLIKGRHKR